MFKNLKIVVCVLLMAIGSSVIHAQSKLGIHAGYGTEIEKLCFGANFEAFLVSKVSFTPSASFYLPIKEEIDPYFGGGEIKIKFWELNADVHFYLSKNETAGFYALLGLNYVRAKVDFPSSLGEDESDSETGANIGFGANFGSSSSTPFLEFKYETVGEGQVVLLFGVRF